MASVTGCSTWRRVLTRETRTDQTVPHELDRPALPIATARAGPMQLGHSVAQTCIQSRRRRLFDNLLVATLDRTVRSKQCTT